MPWRWGAGGAQCGRGEGGDVADGVGESADGGEAGGDGDVGQRQGGGLDQQPGGPGAPGAGEGERTGAEFGRQPPLDLVGGAAEAGGQAGHALAVHDAVGDQSHGAGDEVVAVVPLRGAGGGVGAAARARPQAGLSAGCGAGVEEQVLRLGRDRGAAGPAVGACGEDGGEEPAVEAGVLGPHGAQAALPVGVHPVVHVSSVVRRGLRVWRESDRDVASAGGCWEVADRAGCCAGTGGSP